MALMEWSAALDIGVEAMNAEHREILKAMNAVHDGAMAGMTGPAMMSRIQTLARVTERHFADEERLMDRLAFPAAQTHKAIHARLLTDFAGHAARIEGAGGVADQPFFQFLHLWLSAHIKNIDRKYADHARSGAGAGRTAA